MAIWQEPRRDETPQRGIWRHIRQLMTGPRGSLLPVADEEMA